MQYSAFLRYTSLINAVHLRGCGTTTKTAHVVTVVSMLFFPLFQCTALLLLFNYCLTNAFTTIQFLVASVIHVTTQNKTK